MDEWKNLSEPQPLMTITEKASGDFYRKDVALPLPPGVEDYPTRWRLIKLLFAKGLPRTERLSATRCRRSERGIWQRRYWEHTISTEWDYSRHIDYIHVNPLKHGYVARVRDWPYSTFHCYVQDGVLPLDWCGDIGDLSTAADLPEPIRRIPL